MSSLSSLLTLNLITYTTTAIYIILLLWGNLKLSHYRYSLFMKKRSLSLTFGLNICFIMAIISITNVRGNIINNYKFIFTLISLFVCMLNIWLLLFLLNMRCWLIYFRNERNYYTLKLEWQEIINPTITRNRKDSNWFYNNNHYGKFNFIVKLFGFIHFILCLLSSFGLIVGYIHNHNNNHSNHSQLIMFLSSSLITITFLLAIIFNIIITIKIPYIHDPFKIHWEMSVQQKLIISCLFLNSFMYFTYHQFIKIIDFELFISIMTWISSFIFYVLGHLSTFHLISKAIKASINGSQKKKKNINDQERLAQQQKSDIKIEFILSNKETLNSFMTHISKEFSIDSVFLILTLFILWEKITIQNNIRFINRYSMEILLCFIELTQFQKYLIQQIKSNPHDQYFKHPINTDILPGDIPQSGIIQETENIYDQQIEFGVIDNHHFNKNVNDSPRSQSQSHPSISRSTRKRINDEFLNSAKMKSHKLYNKYIKESSRFEINIPYTIRIELENALKDKTRLIENEFMSLRDLVTLFEPTKQEMMSLLKFSLARFKQTPDFDVILQFYQSKNQITPSTTNPSKTVTIDIP